MIQNYTGAGRALDMGAYTGADESVETRTSSYAKAQETPKGCFIIDNSGFEGNGHKVVSSFRYTRRYNVL